MSKLFFARPPRITKNKVWQVEWEQLNPLTQQVERIRRTFNMNRIKDLKERERFAKGVLKELAPRIKAGYPFESLTAATKLKGQSITVALNNIVELKTQGARRDTVKTYTSQARNFLAWCKAQQLDELPIEAFSKGLAQRFLDSLTKKKSSATTYNNYLRVMKGLWNAMVDREVVEKNPWQTLKSLPKPKPIRNRFSPGQAAQLVKWMSDHDRDLLAFVMHMQFAGLRKTELQRLRIIDVDLNLGIATVPANVAKKHDVRQSTIPSQLLPFFAERVKGMGKLNYLFGANLEAVATQIGTNTVYNRHCEALKACKLDNIPGLTLNSWRHTGASVFVEQFGISVAQRQLGHASTDTTRIYAKPSPYIKDVADMKVPGL